MSRAVLITGVAGGIGFATATLFAREGWKVIGVDCRLPAEVAPIFRFIKADLADPAVFEPLFAEVKEAAGRLDALVNNAAVQVCKPLLETTLEEWDTVMHVNLRSCFLSIQHAFPLMAEAGGAVVNIGSVHAQVTSEKIAGYAASKGGVAALTRAAALEFASAGIRVNSINPGAIDTPMLESGLRRGHLRGSDTTELLRRLGESTPIGRVGRPEEIAQAILFLADGKCSSFITGQCLTIDGGALARLSTE
ncbi:SDR family NAD(P)-dependent oxidoreductase [Citrifermentans bremense]|uniref:SDR family NAD(P)-dependent oxidoreductase n=1 Tax=Citrifermentans bremense TaxID=60035 RepID=UPI0003F59783|nr:SDR family oxidoreductase [Citrifermentans bremense]